MPDWVKVYDEIVEKPICITYVFLFVPVRNDCIPGEVGFSGSNFIQQNGISDL
jgi:hypothetical protein